MNNNWFSFIPIILHLNEINLSTRNLSNIISSFYVTNNIMFNNIYLRLLNHRRYFSKSSAETLKFPRFLGTL